MIGLRSDPGGMLERLVSGLAVVTSRPMPAWALVGGLAVMVQLAEAHRPTDDLDGAGVNDHGELDAAMTVLITDGYAKRHGDGIILNDGTKFDAIGVGIIDPEQLPEPDDPDRWFALSHVWAVETAVERHLFVLDEKDSVTAEVTVPVSTPGPLVAMKLQSHRARRRATPKKASDVYDMYRLLAAHDRDGAIATSLASAPQDLAQHALHGLEDTFVKESAQWAHQLRVHNRGGAMGQVTAEDLEVVGGLCADLLRQHLY